MPNPKAGRVSRVLVDLPAPVAPVPAILLENPRLSGRQPRGKFLPELIEAGVPVRVAAPAHLARTQEDVLGPHLPDGVRMGALEDAAVRHLAKERVEDRPVAALFDRVHPDKNAIYAQQLLPDFVHQLITIDRRLRRQPRATQS